MSQQNPQDERVFLLNSAFSCCCFEDILMVMADAIARKIHGQYISITNTESLYHAQKIPSHRNYINNAVFSCCDGVGVVAAAKIMGLKIPRLHGPDLMLRVCEYGVKKQWRHYFYGGRKGVPELLSKKLTEKFPGLITVGTYSPPFRPSTSKEDYEIVKRINEACPDILWVGLGLLKQERWIAQHINKINVPWMIGVGAAFDFHAGTVKRAPRIFRKAGLEWLFRVCFEPRMIKRNILSFVVITYVIKECLMKNRTHTIYEESISKGDNSDA